MTAKFRNPDASMPSTAETDLIRELEHAQRLHQARQASPRLAAALDRVAGWQSRRLNATYADLVRDPRYAEAIRSSNRICTGRETTAGATPISRACSDHGARAAGRRHRRHCEGDRALALSHELDRALVARLGEDAPLSVASYCAAYRACDNRSERERQIALIVEVGAALDRYVHMPLLRSALAAMRRPARIAGVGALQEFLERGLLSFRGMNGAGEFLAVIKTRETAVMQAILAGGDAPFGAGLTRPSGRIAEQAVSSSLIAARSGP